MIGGTGHEFPIFNPIWFYLVELFERFGTAFAIIGGFSLIGSGVVILICMMENDEIPKCIKKIVIAGVIVLTIGGLIPSKETCYKMVVVSYVTPANIESAKGEVTDIIDYIIDKVNELTDKDKKDD